MRNHTCSGKRGRRYNSSPCIEDLPSGFVKAVTQSNLPEANINRDYRIFEELAYR